MSRADAIREVGKLYVMREEDPTAYAEYKKQNPLHEFSLMLKAAYEPDEALKLYAEGREAVKRGQDPMNLELLNRFGDALREFKLAIAERDRLVALGEWPPPEETIENTAKGR